MNTVNLTDFTHRNGFFRGCLDAEITSWFLTNPEKAEFITFHENGKRRALPFFHSWFLDEDFQFKNIPAETKAAFLQLPESVIEDHWELLNSETMGDYCPRCSADWKEPHHSDCTVLTVASNVEGR